MSQDTNEILQEKYSASEDYCYEIYQNSSGQFDLFIFQYDKKKDGYFMRSDHRYLTESLVEAVTLGDKILQDLEG